MSRDLILGMVCDCMVIEQFTNRKYSQSNIIVI